MKLNKFVLKISSLFAAIDAIGWLILLLLGPIFLLIKPSQSWVLLIIPATWIISALARKNPIPYTPFNLALLIILIQVLVSLYATYDIAVSLQKITGVLWGISVFYALLRLNLTKKGILLSTLVFIAAGAGIAVLGLLGIEWPSNKFILFNSIYEQFPQLSDFIPGIQEGFHPNEVGGALTWIVPSLLVISLWLLFRLKKIHQHLSIFILIPLLILNLFLFSLSTLVLVFSQSRSAYLGMAVSIVLLLLFTLPKKLKFAYLSLLLIGSSVLVYFILQGELIVYINRLFPDNGAASMAFSMNTMSGRVEIWSRAIYAIQDFAFTGMGMNTFRTIVNVLYPLQTIAADVPVKDIGHAHNLFLQVALDLGIPGLIGFLAVYILSFWMILKSMVRLKAFRSGNSSKNPLIINEFYYVLMVGLLGGQLAHLGYSMTDAIALGAKPGIIFWIMQSIICGIFLQVDKKRRRIVQ